MQPKTRQWLQSALVIAVLLALAWWFRGTPSGTPSDRVGQAPASGAARSPAPATATARPPRARATPTSGSPSAAAQSPVPTRTRPTAEPTRFRAATPTRRAPTRTPAPRPTATRETDGFPRVDADDLPPEAKQTLRLIDRGGPFPFDKDGSVFSNRERILPRKPGGYYREYTVITPGEDDRGARRIIAGDGGELYYTDDHYASFRRIER